QRLQRFSAAPAGGKLAFVLGPAMSAPPGRARAFVIDSGPVDELQRAIVVEVVFHPQLRPHFLERNLADDGTEIFVADERGDAFARQDIAVMADRDERVGGCQFFHSLGCPASVRRKAAGSSPRSRTSTSAEPTIAPAAWRPTAATSSAERMPNPAHTGSSEIAVTRSR